MDTPSSDDARVAEVASKLTKAQSRFVIDSNEQRPWFSFGHKPGEKCIALGLISRTRGRMRDNIVFTPLGLAVRSHLLSQEQNHVG